MADRFSTPGPVSTPHGTSSPHGISTPATDRIQAGQAGGSQPTGDIDPETFTNIMTIALLSGGVDTSQLTGADWNMLYRMLWEDPYMQSIIQSYHKGLQLDPANTAASFPFLSQALQDELFDPTRTHSQLVTATGLHYLRKSGVQLTQTQQAYATSLNPAVQDPQVTSAIAQAAAEFKIPYDIALATAMAESGLNPKSVGDQGTSFGLFQLHQGGELDDCGLTPDQASDPLTNAMCAMNGFVRARNADPSIVNDPGRWAAAAQRPADPNTYAVRVNNLLNTSFGGNPSANVPKPFEGNFPISLDYGQQFGSETEEGIDYETPQGTPLYSPFAGTIHVEDQGTSNWGKRVFVKLDNGYTFAIGHMTSFSVAEGQRVNSGVLLGESGGRPGDPSSGASTGDHIEIQWMDQSNHFLNPHAIMDPILSGQATFAGLNMSGMDTTVGGSPGATPQERLLGDDPFLDKKYPQIVSAFNNYYGRNPTAKELLQVLQAAGQDPKALDNWFRMQPSHVPGMTQGQYKDLKSALDSTSTSMFGHTGTDGMLQELQASGYTTPAAIKFWLEEQDIAGKMDPNTYQQLYQLNQPYMQGVYNETGFDGRIAVNQYNSAVANGYNPPAQSTHQNNPPAPPAPPSPPGVRNKPGQNPGQ